MRRTSYRYTGSIPTKTTTSFSDIDATNFPALPLMCEVGDVIDLEMVAFWSHTTAGNSGLFDWLIDRPTSADTTIRATDGGTCAEMIEFPASGNDSLALPIRAQFVVTERGIHTFKPQWALAVASGTMTIFYNGTYYSAASIHTVKNLGPETA
jgi:hypothetical protein